MKIEDMAEMIVALSAEVRGLTMTVATLAARDARREEDPEDAIMRLTAPLTGIVQADGQDISDTIERTLLDLGETIETLALSQLQRQPSSPPPGPADD